MLLGEDRERKVAVLVGHEAVLVLRALQKALAPDAATADAVATVVGVLPVDEGVSFAEALPGVGCCLLAADGTLVRTDVWSAREID